MKNINIPESDSNFEYYKKIIKRLIKKWHYFVISIFTTLLISLLVVKSSQPRYQNSMMMLFTDLKENRSGVENSEMQFEMFDISSNIEDEIGKISSFPVIKETIKRLNINVSYYKKKGLIKEDIYKNCPFTVIFNNEENFPVNSLFQVNFISEKKFKLKCKSEEKVGMYNYQTDKIVDYIKGIDIDGEYQIGEDLSFDGYKFKLIWNGYYNFEDITKITYFFNFNNLEYLTYLYQGSMKVKRTSIQSSLVEISCKSPNPVLVTDYLNSLAEIFLERNLEEKNSIADKTIKFIAGQIGEIADTLGIAANQLREFRTAHNVMDINFLAQSVYQQVRALEDQRAILLVKSKYYDYIKSYFESNQDLTDLLAPSAMGVDDPQLTSLINKLTTVNSERTLILDNKSYKHPNLPNLNAEINNLKKTILENIDYIVNTSNITINDIDKRISLLKVEERSLPSIEEQLKDIERQFHINDAIYTLLLTTRARAEIAKASNSPDYEIIEPGKYNSVSQVAPMKGIIYSSGFILGLLIPMTFILIVYSLDERLTEKKEIEKITHYPNIGSIARSDLKSMLPLVEFPKSIISESFRSARTSLQFFNKGQIKQKILITSSMSGDGKTFAAMNLAAAFSYYGKKTLLLEFDLRNPKIAEYMGLADSKGLSSYLINDARLEDIIIKTKAKNLDVIPTGLIPPNPVELIASDNTKNLIEILQSIYDYIIIDSPPVGIVTDPFLLFEYSDANIFVVRLNHTDKKLYASLMRDFELKEISNVAILINDDEDKIQSSYYDQEGSKLSYFKKKIKTFKALVSNRKK